VNRSDFQQLADVRIAEAKTLFAQGHFSGAYYLAGYAVECALKACIAKLTNQHDFPDKDAAKCYTHVIENLVALAQVQNERKVDSDADPDLGANWLTVKDWTEQSRYAQSGQGDAQRLLDAITDAAHGVLPWIKQRW
jgi:HEPN domain-containing protein